ncbi:hypothetical protein KKE03_01755 [Patescibacteria group bacterium]|nr:hypothetical protein [Patescibacteria group bacterium]
MAIIPTILIAIWFRGGNILGTGESGLPFYDFNLQLNINNNAWAYYTLGHPLNIGTAATPTYWFFAQLQHFGIPGVVLQGIFFWLVFMLSGLAIYKLVKELFPEISNLACFIGVLFYWFNPFSLVNIWNRFLNNFIVFYALLPISVYFFIKGLRTKRYIYAILIGLASAILSYALTSIAFVFLMWGVLFYFGFFHFLIHKKDRSYILKFFFLTVLFWFLANLWWISQVFSYVGLGSFDAVTSTSFNTGNNYNIFSQISQRLGLLTYIFRLKHVSFYEYTEQLKWVGIYQFPILTFFEFLISGIILIPLFLKRRNVYILMFGGLFLIALFLAKGNNPPFGEFFDKAFLYFSFLQIFRNPLEKIGFILSFPAAILFAVGCFEIKKLFGAKWGKIFWMIIVFWILVVWGFPFWIGYVFTGNETPTNKLEVGFQVKVPQFYQDASDWLASQKDNFRLTVLPLGSEGITYSWENGYSGVELSNQIFPKSSISFNTNIPFYDDISSNLERIFLTRQNFPKVMSALNARYILTRGDIDWKIRRMRDPSNITDRLQKIALNSGLKEVKNFGKLSFWEYIDWKDNSIYLTTSLIKSGYGSSIEDLLNVEPEQDTVLYNGKIPIDDKLTKSEIIYPIFKFDLKSKSIEQSILLREDIIFPSVRILPSSFLYPLILIKEGLETARITDQKNKIIKKISLLGKRLVEVEKEFESNNFDGVDRALDNYHRQLQELYAYPLEGSPYNNPPFFIQEDLYKLFFRHFQVIDNLVNNSPNDKKAGIIYLQKLLKEFVLKKGIEPIYGYLEKADYPLKDRNIYQFRVDKAGNYELLFNINNWDSYFKPSYSEYVQFQIDDKLILKKGELKKNGLLSFGSFNITEGTHEIGWNMPEPINLIDGPSELLMKVDHGVAEKSFPIKNFNPYATYVLSVDYLIKQGSGVQVSIEGNNDPVENNAVRRQFLKDLGPDGYNFDIRNYTAFYTPRGTSDTATLIFRVSPWNNCKGIFWTEGQEKCENKEFSRPYDRTTQVLIRNVSLIKVMTEGPFLRLEEENFSAGSLPEIIFTKVNGSEYKIDIKNATDKYALILSELYDPAWEVLTSDGIEVGNSHFLANGYANGWLIDKKGDYEMIVKFTPQDLLVKGRKVSLSAVIAGLILVLWKLRKNHDEKN